MQNFPSLYVISSPRPSIFSSIAMSPEKTYVNISRMSANVSSGDSNICFAHEQDSVKSSLSMASCMFIISRSFFVEFNTIYLSLLRIYILYSLSDFF